MVAPSFPWGFEGAGFVGPGLGTFWAKATEQQHTSSALAMILIILSSPREIQRDPPND